MQTLNTEISSIIDNLKSSKGSGSSSLTDWTDWNSISDFYINVQNYIESLTMEQKAALANIGFLFSILVYTISIIGIFVGDRIVEYLQLEQRFPWAARYFELRKNLDYIILFEIVY